MRTITALIPGRRFSSSYETIASVSALQFLSGHCPRKYKKCSVFGGISYRNKDTNFFYNWAHPFSKVFCGNFAPPGSN